MRRSTNGPVRNNLKEQLEWLHKNHAAALAACFSYSVSNEHRVAADDANGSAPYKFTKTAANPSAIGDAGLEEEMSLAELEALQEAETSTRVSVPTATKKTLPAPVVPAKTETTATSSAYFSSSAADFDDDFDSPPPFITRHSKSTSNKPPLPAATSALSRKGKEKFSPGDAMVEENEPWLDARAPDQVDDDVIDLTQESSRPQGTTVKRH